MTTQFPVGYDLPARPLPLASVEDRFGATEFLNESGVSLTSLVLALFDQSDDCIKVIGTDGTLQFMNCNGKKAMQIEDFSLVAGKPWDSLWPDESKGLVRHAVVSALAGESNRFEAFCPTAMGEARWWEVSVSPLQDATGGCVGILSTSRDITERRRREEAAATTASEMRHRLLNAHAVSAALVHACGRDRPEHREFATDVAERLARLSDIQVQLLEAGADLSLQKLCEAIETVFSHSGKHIVITGLPDVPLDEQRARALSLILGELTTNSLKHGALGQGGSVQLSGVLVGNSLQLTWMEEADGWGETSAPTLSTGQGMTLIRRMLRLFGGSLDVQRGDDKYCVHLSLDVA